MDVKFDLSNKKTIAGLIILVCIVALIFYSPNIVSLTNPTVCTIDGVCQHEERVHLLTELIPVFISIGILIGVAVFFFMSSRLENKEKDLSKVTDTLVQFLNKDEKLVVQKLIENDGKVLQAEVSRIEGIGKVKSHRIIQRLVDRGVIEVEGFGKTNIIKLNKGIKDVLLGAKK
ncbi:MAG: hypothetical protein WC821_03305 [archaeon]|jgi:uncharacterized membrane protein